MIGQNRYKQCEKLMIRALAIFEKTYGPDDPRIASGRYGLASLYAMQGKYTLGEPLAESALTRRAALYAEDGAYEIDYDMSLQQVADLFMASDRPRQAVPLYQKRLALAENGVGKQHRALQFRLLDLADALLADGKAAPAATAYERVLNILRDESTDVSPACADRIEKTLASIKKFCPMTRQAYLEKEVIELRKRYIMAA